MNLENNEKLETYRKTSTIVYNLQQDIIKSMEFFLYSHVKDDHCFMITIKDAVEYVLINDYSLAGHVSLEILDEFCKEFNLNLVSITSSSTNVYSEEDTNKLIYVDESCHYKIKLVMLKEEIMNLKEEIMNNKDGD